MPYQRISTEEAKSLLESGDVTVMDVRDAGSFSQSHIKNAIHVSDANVEEFVTTADQSKPLLIYCFHGNSSQGAADYFNSKGFNEVYSLDGGYEEWRTQS